MIIDFTALNGGTFDNHTFHSLNGGSFDNFTFHF